MHYKLVQGITLFNNILLSMISELELEVTQTSEIIPKLLESTATNTTSTTDQPMMPSGWQEEELCKNVIHWLSTLRLRSPKTDRSVPPQTAFRISPVILSTFYTRTVESILAMNLTSWFWKSSDQDRKALCRVHHSRVCLPYKTFTPGAADQKQSRTSHTLTTTYSSCSNQEDNIASRLRQKG